MNDANPLVSIIIVNYNGKKYLKNCFDSICKINYPNFEVIFVDNGSGDESLTFVKTYYPEVKILELKENLGLAIASNKGAEISKGKYLFFLNNDTIVDSNILRELVKVTESDPKIGACACNVFTYDSKHEIGSGLSCDRFGYPCGNLGAVFYPDAAIFVRKSVFQEIEGFDPKLFLYGEDRDLCWRIWLQGYRIEPVRSAKFLHDSACTLIGAGEYRTNIWKRELGERNLIRSMLKNYSLSSLFYILPQYLCLSFLEIIALLCMGQIKAVKQAYFGAYFWNIANFRDTWGEHKKINNKRVISDRVIRKKMTKQIGKIQVFKWVGIPKFDTITYKV